jgi:hypothetical protein
MTEITDLSPTDSSNTEVTGESLDGSIANMGRMDNTLQAVMGLLARSIRTNVLRFLDNTDDTKKVKLDLSGLPTATERTWTAPYYSGTLGLVSDIIGYIRGLDLTRNGTDATNDVDIAAGSAVDSTGAVSILLVSPITKRIDAAWAVGTGNGGLDTGAVGDFLYYIWLIRRPDTGVVDALFSLSNTAPTMPTNYTQKALIGAVRRNGGVNGLPYWLDERAQTGTFTPTYTAGGVSTGVTYTTRTGSYTKIGRVVTFTLRVTLSSAGSATGVVAYGGLPFTVGSSDFSGSTGFVNNFSGLTGALLTLANNGTTSVSLRQSSATGASTVTQTNVTNTADIIISGSYEV